MENVTKWFDLKRNNNDRKTQTSLCVLISFAKKHHLKYFNSRDYFDILKKKKTSTVIIVSVV